MRRECPIYFKLATERASMGPESILALNVLDASGMSSDNVSLDMPHELGPTRDRSQSKESLVLVLQLSRFSLGFVRLPRLN